MAQELDHSGHQGGADAPVVIELYRCTDPGPWQVAEALTGDLVVEPDAGRGPAQGASGAAVSALEQAMAADVRLYLSLAERLARHPADAHLFTLLDQIDTEKVDEAALVELAAAAERVESAAHAAKLRAAAALAGRQRMACAELAEHTRGPSGLAGDELTARLRTSAKGGADLVRRGHALNTYLMATGDALSRGEIDAARARVIVDGLQHVGWEVAVAVEDRVLPKAADRTAAQLRYDVSRALVAVDADEAEARARARATSRRVTRPRNEGDEIASMRIEGPAGDILALDLALDATARAAKAAGDERTMDQLRFDALAGIGEHALATGHLGDPAMGADLARTGGHLPHLNLTMTLDQLMPAGDQPPHTREAERAPGTEPAPEEAAAGSDAPEITWPPALSGERLEPEQVPELAGYGPISPATARALAAGGVWRRIVTDPLTGSVLDVGHTRYRPTRAIAEHIVARDRTCVRPGCSHQASSCQLDHTIPFNHADPAHGGPTSVANLGPLCARDHQVKTHAGFHLTQVEPGIFEWTTPTGHRYRRERDGTTTSLTHQPPRRDPAWDELPPF
ncbi:HNH endonuclease signature motif containing protein [Ruania albidiflava]|uniref:HNH endonuclease signature motif containing protein n=1 Tax=Ruania albidiflava TaxID=366586 RepID=UPI0003B2F225|nr:HNH endonuclease signature motif containing protein [Ruania albidiflava]